jgi:hypothetical protein
MVLQSERACACLSIPGDGEFPPLNACMRISESILQYFYSRRVSRQRAIGETSSVEFDVQVVGADGCGYLFYPEGKGDYDDDEDSDSDDSDAVGLAGDINRLHAASIGCDDEETWKKALWSEMLDLTDSDCDEFEGHLFLIKHRLRLVSSSIVFMIIYYLVKRRGNGFYQDSWRRGRHRTFLHLISTVSFISRHFPVPYFPTGYHRP